MSIKNKVIITLLLLVSVAGCEEAKSEFTEGQKLLSENKYEEAVSYYQQILENDETNQEALEGMAEALIGLESYKEARYCIDYMTDLDAAIEYTTKINQIYPVELAEIEEGLAYIEEERYEEAVTFFEAYVEEKGYDNQLALTNLVEALIQTKDYEQALTYATHIVDEEAKANYEMQIEDMKPVDITEELSSAEIKKLSDYLNVLDYASFTYYDQETIDINAMLDLGYWQYILFDKESMNFVVQEDTTGRVNCYNIMDYDDFNQKINSYFDYALEKDDAMAVAGVSVKDNKLYFSTTEAGFWCSVKTDIIQIIDQRDGTFIVNANVSTSESDDDYFKHIGTATATFEYSEKLGHYVIKQYAYEGKSRGMSWMDFIRQRMSR